MSSSELKLKAKEQLMGKKKNAALMVLVFVIVEGILGAIANSLFPGEIVEINGMLVKQTSTVASILQTAIGVFLGLGMVSYFLKIARGEDADIMELFSKGNLFIKAFLTVILTALAIFGGTLLFVIPGIILAFGYSMISFIYIDNPDIGIVEVMKKSREMMKGHKWQLFCLDLSFIGWVILGLFTFGILYFWLLPYMAVTEANFYESIKNN